MASTMMARVRGVIAAAMLSGVGSAKAHLTLSRLSSRFIKPSEPPNTWLDPTYSSPVAQSASSATSQADCPEATATPAVPPSSEAMRRSSAATVGFEPRE